MTATIAPDNPTRDDAEPTSDDDLPEDIIASFVWPSQQFLRLRILDDDTFTVEAVSGKIHRNGHIVSDDETIITLFEGDGKKAATFYNTLVTPLVQYEYEAAQEIYETTNEGFERIATNQYTNELEEVLETLNNEATRLTVQQ